MRNALLVGINDYKWAPLEGCVNDAKRMAEVLSKNYDGHSNFQCSLLTSDNTTITTNTLNKQTKLFFEKEADVALFYFSGHGSHEERGYLITQDAKAYDQGVSFYLVLQRANKALESGKINEVVIILDCCFSAQMGDAIDFEKAYMHKGLSIITSSNTDEMSKEKNGKGLFTSVLYNALSGGAADILGRITVASVYNYVEKFLAWWDQRPVYKSYITRATSLRKSKPKISIDVLNKMADYFEAPVFLKALDPRFEPTLDPRDEEREKIFSHLQKYEGAGLLEPVGEEHMYYAAKNSKACELTKLGEFYWQLVKENRITY